MSDVDTIIFYRSFYESISELDSKTQLELYNAIFKLAFDGEDTEFKGIPKAMFSLIKPLISANIKNQTRGKKGGRPLKKEIDEEFVDEIEAEYQAVFGSTKILSIKNRELIYSISEENNLELSDWQLIFKNASRGWNYPDGKHVAASLKKILTDWDSFHRGDNGLAPDKEELEIKKQEAEAQKLAKEKLDTSLDTEFFIYDEYRLLTPMQKLKAQEYFNEDLKITRSEEKSTNNMLVHLRSIKNNE